MASEKQNGRQVATGVTRKMPARGPDGKFLRSAKGRPRRKRAYSKHRYHQMKRAINALGKRAIDRRTRVGQMLEAWRVELVQDLGGEAALSAQQRMVLDTVVKSQLLLSSVDAWLLAQASLVNARQRSLLPVLRQRTQLADGLMRQLALLGLERKQAAPVPLSTYLKSRETAPEHGEPEPTASDPATVAPRTGEPGAPGEETAP